MSADRFPSISQDGLRIAASALPRGGQAVQYVGDVDGVWRPRIVEGDASGGVFQTPARLLFVRNKDGDPQNGAILLSEGGRVTEFHPPGLEGFTCHNGIFAGWRRGDRLKAVTVSRDGHRAGLVDVGDGRNVVLEVDGKEIDRGPIAEPRYTGEALVWCKFDRDNIRRIFGREHHGAETVNLSVLPGNEYWPLVIETSRGKQVLTHGEPERGAPLFLRPWGKDQFLGHIVASGFTDRPDARALLPSIVLVAFSNLIGLQRVLVDLSAPPVDVRGPVIVVPSPPPPPPPPLDPKEPPVADVRTVPNLIHVIERTKRDFPTAWQNCHRLHLGQALSEEFARRAAYACSLEDARFGLNGKRGDPHDLSDDCVCFKHDDGRESVIDFGGGAGGDNPTVQWSVVGHYQVPGPPLQLWIRAERVSGGGSTPSPNPGTPTPPAPAPSAFPAFEVPRDIFEAATLWFRAEIHDRDKLGGDSMGAGALGYFVPPFYASIVDDIKASGVPAHSDPAQVFALWAAMARRGVVRGLAIYHRDQGRP